MKKLMMICLMAMSCLMVQAQDFDAFFSKWNGIEYQEITNIRDSLLRQMKENMPSFGSIPVQFDFDEDSVNWTVEVPQDSTSLLKIQRVFSAAQKKVLLMRSLWLASKTSQVRWESEA